jgi:hypothetical protein
MTSSDTDLPVTIQWRVDTCLSGTSVELSMGVQRGRLDGIGRRRPKEPWSGTCPPAGRWTASEESIVALVRGSGSLGRGINSVSSLLLTGAADGVVSNGRSCRPGSRQQYQQQQQQPLAPTVPSSE